jgi:hypothetical protein
MLPVQGKTSVTLMHASQSRLLLIVAATVSAAAAMETIELVCLPKTQQLWQDCLPAHPGFT